MDFDRYIDSIEEILCAVGNVQTKTVDYGVQIILTGSAKRVTLTIYNGKKGIKFVWGGGDSELRERAAALLKKALPGGGETETSEKQEKKKRLSSDKTAGKEQTPVKSRLQGRKKDKASASPETGKSPAAVTSAAAEAAGSRPTSSVMLLTQEPGFDGVWMGSDESGKGDYFGPLVVAAVCLDTAAGEKLIAAGVRDCKALTDKKILILADRIEKTALASSVLVMKPQAYNMRYDQVKKAAGTLNVLLSYGHIAALKQTLQKYPSCRWALVDQFAKNDRISPGVHEFCADMRVIQRPRAEEDIAVAAASVLARAAFIRTMEQLAAEAGVAKLPKGGGEAATRLAQKLVREKGKEFLARLVKLHFANTRKAQFAGVNEE